MLILVTIQRSDAYAAVVQPQRVMSRPVQR